MTRASSFATIVALGLAAALGSGSRAGDGEPTLLIHVTDTHVPEDNKTTLEAVAPFLPRASAVVVTGDLTDFGGLEAYSGFEKLFSGIGRPVAPALGNHDGTFRSLQDVFWRTHGRSYYAIDAGKLRLLVLDSSTCQHTGPHHDPAELAWIRSEVAASRGRQLVVALHHAPWDEEYVTAWARARLPGALEGANVAAVLAGHYHISYTQRWGASRVVVGGASQGRDPGFTVVELDGTRTRGAYHPDAGGERALFTDEVPEHAPEPLPAPELAWVGSDLFVSLPATAHVATGAVCQLVGAGSERPFSGGVARYRLAELDEGRGAAPGPRGVVVSEGHPCEGGRISSAVLDVPGGRSRFRVELGSGIRTRPVVLLGRLLVGTDGGDLIALEPGTGRELWRFATRGPVLARPVLAEGRIVLASGDGHVRALGPDGKLAWDTDVRAPVYSGPVTHEGRILVTDLDGTLHVLDPSGNEKRSRRVAAGAVQAPPILVGGLLVQGAWDGRVHAFDLASLDETWSAETDGARGARDQGERAKRYSSPAETPLAAWGDRLFACDHAGKLTVFDVGTGERREGADDAWAVTVRGDAVFVKGRRSLRRTDAAGRVVWTTELRLGVSPAEPLVIGSQVWAVSDDGEVSVVDAATGAVLRRERVSPGELTLASPGAEGDLVYVGSLDGSLTALER